ncbi:hypothetical protein [Luteimonas deserti]|uniref:hypothetical protein n=1 Tax=Luteimonas deserti TaxID=2752306 RepID=UPI001C5CA381|nr:hypothetical protein [Luteimonas deserti]
MPDTRPSAAAAPSHRDSRRARAIAGRASPWWLAATAVVVVGGVVMWRMALTAPAPVAGTAGAATADTAAAPARPGYAATAMAAVGKPRLRPGDDPNDVAAYFQPGDPEPGGAELIGALQDAGIRTGIGAFNPPGTSPPLEGLAVPEDFELPQGYVRHHQATDDGQPIEPILMFAPDFALVDANGHPVDLPDNRVVTADLAPAGLPLRQVRIPGQ